MDNWTDVEDKLPEEDLKANFDKSIKLLRDLADIQNGPPLVTYTDVWTHIMRNVYDFLEKHEKADKDEV